MAARPLNSIEGFSVGEDDIAVVFANGRVTATSLLVSGETDLGPISNITIAGGNSGQVLSTDGSGNLTFIDPSGGLDVDGGQTPFLIPENETFTVVENRQAFFQLPITIEGDLVVDGVLFEIPAGETTDDIIEGNTNLFFTETRFNTAMSQYNGGIDTNGNISANIITANILQGDGSLITNLSIGSGTFIENGSSEVRVDTNSNVRVSVSGTANVLVVTSTGANISGYANVTGDISAGNVSATGITATTLGGTLTTAAQPNITSVGTLDLLSVTGNISGNVVTANTLTVNGETTVTGNIVPSANNTYNLGAPDKVWNELYLGSNTLFIDGVPLSITNGSLTFGNNAVIVSGDSNVSTDDLAEGEVNLYFTTNRANTVIENFNGNIDTSGSITANSFIGNISGSVTGNVTGNVTGQVSDISNHTTSNLTEGTNLYFTQARARKSISSSGNINYNNSTGVISQSLSTSDITEGTNLYFTTERVRGNISASGDINYDSTNGVFSVTTYKSTDFSNDLANKTTSNLTEGTNLYFTETRARNSFSAGTGISLDTGIISIGQDVSTNANVSFNRVSNLSAPASSLDATNKQYVDEVAQGLKARTAARVLVDENLDATYDNGTDGVGATLTSDSNGAFPEIDGISSEELNEVGQRILVIGQTIKAQNGLYVMQVAGDESTPWQLRRCVECDEDTEIPGSFVFVKEGTTYGTTGWVAVTDLPFTVGTTAINWTQFSGAGTFLAGTGLTLTGNEFSVNSSQTQITELGTLTGLNVNGNVIAQNISANTGVFSGNGAGLANLVGSNVTGTVANATHSITANTIVDSTQPNITSVGTLTSLAVTGNANVGNIGATAGVFTTVSGNGSALTGLNANNLASGTVPSARLSGSYAISVTSATTSGTVTTAAQSNITSVGTLTSLNVTGNVGIGTSAPGAKLHVAGNLGAIIGGGGSCLKLTNTDTGNYASIGAGLVGVTNVGMDFSVDGARAMVITGAGNVGIGTTSPSERLDVNGVVRATEFIETSSLRYKENVRNIDSVDISGLRPVLFDRKNGSSKDEAGFIAEEVFEVLPNAVALDSEGRPDGIYYSRLMPYLINHIKTLEKRIQDLENNKPN